MDAIFFTDPETVLRSKKITKNKKQKTKRNWHFIIRKTEIQFWGINKDYSRIINPGRIPIPE